MTIAPQRVDSLPLSLLQRDDLVVDDLTGLPEDLRYELIEGRLVVSPYAKPIHQLIAKRVGDAIEERCPDEFLINIEQAVLVSNNTELRPDVVLLSERSADVSPVPASDVLLVVEVISNSSRKTDRRDKLAFYEQAKIPSYWIVDPLADRITLTQFLLLADETYGQVLSTDDRIALRQPWEITLDLPAWTRRRDRIRANARSPW